MVNFKRLYFAILLTSLFLNIYGQDVIVTKSGNPILSKIVDISNDTIKYKKWANQDGPIYT